MFSKDFLLQTRENKDLLGKGLTQILQNKLSENF